MIPMHIIVLLASFFLYRSDPLLALSMYMGVTCMVVFSWMSSRCRTLLWLSCLPVGLLLAYANVFLPIACLWGAVAAWLLQWANRYFENSERQAEKAGWPEGLTLVALALLLISTFHYIETSTPFFLLWCFGVFAGVCHLMPGNEAFRQEEDASDAVQADSTDEHRNVEVPSEHADVEQKAEGPSFVTRESERYWFFDNPTLHTYQHAVKYLRDNISSYPAAVQPTLLSIATSTEKILSCMEEDPLEKETGLRFLHHFLPSVFSLADKHARLFKEQAMGEDSLVLALEKSAAMLERLKKAFAKKYFKMLNSKITDLSVEINTLDTMLKMRGM